MPAGYSSRCIACNAPQRPEIDRRLLSGESSRSVSAWLETQGINAAHTGLSNHKREHVVSVSEAVQATVAAAEAVHANAVSAGLNRVQELERNAQCMIEMRDAGIAELKRIIYDPPKTLVSLVTRAAAEVRQSIVAVQTALGEVAGVPQHDPALQRLIDDPGLSDAAHDLLAHISLTGDTSGPGVHPQPG